MKRFFPLCILALLFARPAMGLCDVPNPRLICAEYFASRVVVEATLVKITPIKDKAEPEFSEAFVYSLRADSVLRGQIDGVFRVYEGNDSGRASFGWKVGEKYLLFLFYLRAERAWGLDGCGNSGPLSGAKAALEQIKTIQTTNHDSGVIHGVAREEGSADAIPPLHIEARGTNGVFRATTNAKGEFEMKVPAGRYIVRVKRAGKKFTPDALSYENPNDLKIEPGGCVQIQLWGQEDIRWLRR